MNVKLHRATAADLPLVKNLVPYYIYDMSEHMKWPCRADGRFDGCDRLATYWTKKGNDAFVLRAGREPAGFALVDGNHKTKNIDYSIGEFFVLRKFRGRGVGGSIARQLFDRFPGNWIVEQLAGNKPAVEFWRKVVGRYTANQFKQRTQKCDWGKTIVLLFRSPR